ncbi:flocculation protein FLO11 [Drosophila erecta]|uniref:Protein TsetseEP domain-containing protein n=1 Tax=Drosophila erecta TaxID=7220 RepID=B3NLN5_DROER|nr:flocculation protein FLO11 [Drosophila erecta]EDV55010.1 uncharacterized protein Dere_GG20996 [Drosophila erecta]
MQSSLIAILLATVAIGSCTANPSLISGPSRILEIMSATSDMQRNNPQLALECFDYYNALFKSEYEEYVDEYNQCITTYDGGYELVLQRYVPIAWGISNTTFDSCMYLLDCDNQNSSENALSCYASEGPIKSKELSSVAYNASTQVSSLRQEVEQLVFTRDQCCNESSRNYEISSGESYQALQNCLAGLSPVPESSTTTTTSATTTTPQTTTTTPQPTTTTPQPTTTASPVVSTVSSTTRPATTSAPIISTSSTGSPSTAARFSSMENNSGRFARKLDSIFKHMA